MHNPPPSQKPELPIWVWALIGSGGTLLLFLAGYGIWNLIRPTNTSIQSINPIPASNQVSTSPPPTPQSPPPISPQPTSSAPIQSPSSAPDVSGADANLVLKVGEINPPPGSVVNEQSTIAVEIKYSIKDDTYNPDNYLVGMLFDTVNGNSIGTFIDLKSPSGSFVYVEKLDKFWNRNIAKPVRVRMSLNRKTATPNDSDASTILIRSQPFEYKVR